MKVILCDFCKKEVSKLNLIKLKKISCKRAYNKQGDSIVATDVSIGQKIEICKSCYDKMIDYIIENCAVQ